MTTLLDAPSVLNSRSYEDGVVIQADCLSWMKEALPDESVELIAADFPFKLPKPEDYAEFIEGVAHEMARVLVDGGNAVVLNNPHATLRYSHFFLEAGLDVRNGIALFRPGSFTVPLHLGFSHNYAAIFVKGDKRAHWNPSADVPVDSMGYQNGRRRGRLWHPQAVPVELWNLLLPLMGSEGETVLDIFAGSGSIILPARLLGMRWIAVDRDPTSFLMCQGEAESGVPLDLFEEAR
jgi:DNA modification methylase